MAEENLHAWKYAERDNLEGLKALVPSQVEPNSSSHSIEDHLHTLLMCAAAHGSVKCARFLITECKANVNKRNFTGFSALHWAAFSGRIECVKLLLDAGALLESQTDDGRTPLHIAASRGHLQFLKFIVSCGADLHAVTSIGWTAVHYALINNQKSVVKYLLDQKVEYDEYDVNMETIDSIVKEYNRTWFNELISH